MAWDLVVHIPSILFGAAGFIAFIWAIIISRRPIVVSDPPPPIHIPDYSMTLESMGRQLKTLESDMPLKVLRTIQGNTATMKGELAEHISYLQLHSQYDRLISLGSVVDFVGIRFDSSREAEDGTIDFIDIKTGKHSRLTQEQVKVRRLVDGSRMRFLKFKITTNVVSGAQTEDAD